MPDVVGFYAERVREQNERREELLRQIAEKKAADTAAPQAQLDKERLSLGRLQKATEARQAENLVQLHKSQEAARAAIQSVLAYAEQKQALPSFLDL